MHLNHGILSLLMFVTSVIDNIVSFKGKLKNRLGYFLWLSLFLCCFLDYPLLVFWFLTSWFLSVCL